MPLNTDIKKKILDKSDMYTFYKDGYEQYKSDFETLLKKQNELIRQDNDYKVKNEHLNNELKKLSKQQKELVRQDNDYKVKNEHLNNELKKLSKQQENFKNEIQNLKKELECKNNGAGFSDIVNRLNNELQTKNLELDNINNKLDSLYFEIDELNNHIFIKNNEINQLNYQLDLQKNELKKLSFPFHNFNEYLIESYLSPIVFSPFSDESKRCFAFMEEVASYLISRVNNSNNKPLISVIMPVYNRKDVVMKAIDSVLNQTYENFELIVVDDASTDGTTELLKKITHEKVKIVYHEQNRYASGARNTGLKVSKGEYIAYLDSDNLLDKRYLEATVGAFLLLPDAGGIYSAQYRYETYDSKPFAVQFGAFNKSLLHNHNYIDMNCFAHRRNVYEEIGGFDETLKGADDWELILKISNHFKIYSVPFLLSKCYLGVVENRVSDLIPTDMGKIRSQNEVLPTKKGSLNKNVNIIIPIYESEIQITECISHILALGLNNLKIIVSNNCSSIDLNEIISSFDADNIILIQNKTDNGFTEAVNEGIQFVDSDADILLLNKNAILTEGSLESLQNHAYNLPNCGLVVSQQVLPNGTLIQKHVPYGHVDYWCDITPSNFYKNIINVPIFHNGEILELNLSPFFCTYIKKEILDEYGKFNSTLGKHYHSLRLLSEYVRNIMQLKIYHVSEAIVINNLDEKYRNDSPINDYDYMFIKNTWTNDVDFIEDYVWDF